MTQQTFSPRQKQTSALPWIVAVGALTFAAGAVGAFMFAQNQQNQQSQAIAALTAQLAEMQVSRNQTPDMLDITAPVIEVVAQAPASVTSKAPSASIPSASAALASKTPALSNDARTQEEKIADAIAIVNRNKMRMLTEGVVAGLYSVTSEQTDGQSTRIALNSRNAASAAESIEALLAEAAANGTLDLPESVATVDGKVDSQTLLFDLVQRSLEDGGAEEIAAAKEMRRLASEASAAKTDVVNGQRFYTVEAGDSLAYISLQFYGSTNDFDRIFQANRSKITSPDKIQIGQRLVIPEV